VKAASSHRVIMVRLLRGRRSVGKTTGPRVLSPTWPVLDNFTTKSSGPCRSKEHSLVLSLYFALSLAATASCTARCSFRTGRRTSRLPETMAKSETVLTPFYGLLDWQGGVLELETHHASLAAPLPEHSTLSLLAPQGQAFSSSPVACLCPPPQ